METAPALRALGPGDQSGRTVVVTGANSGIGLVTARAFARAGAHVVLAVRDVERGRRAARSVPGDAEVRQLDLADLASVRRFADGWDRSIDVLVNNAGVANVPLRRTRDGFELQMGTNHLGHFALTNALLPHVTDRVVTVASNAHRAAVLDLDDLDFTGRPYRSGAAYAESKLANLLFTLELQRRLTASGSPVRALAAHPGAAATDLNRHLGPVMTAVASTVGRFVQQSDTAGAEPTLWAATAQLPGGGYAGPAGFREQRGHPTLVGRSPAASDPDLARALWAVSEELTGSGFPAVGAGARSA
ncbi:oxidoreductase [Streptomyces polygonati]|uniref:Oxidoreductase n=1 Tax=Streptomyces polygonati TaxID=1617087 RepID=A0ABV8I0R2_9ACTN